MKNEYRGKTLEKLKSAFRGELPDDSEVMKRLEAEWKKWENSGVKNCGPPSGSRSYRDSFTWHKEGEGLWSLTFHKAVFEGGTDCAHFTKKMKKDLTVYTDCVFPEKAIYIKKSRI